MKKTTDPELTYDEVVKMAKKIMDKKYPLKSVTTTTPYTFAPYFDSITTSNGTSTNANYSYVGVVGNFAGSPIYYHSTSTAPFQYQLWDTTQEKQIPKTEAKKTTNKCRKPTEG